MERFFPNTYNGDPGIPHTSPKAFYDIWMASAFSSTMLWFHPYMWQTATQWNWHDREMLFEQHHWKKALKKGEPYEFSWNKNWTKEERDSYYFNWTLYWQ